MFCKQPDTTPGSLGKPLTSISQNIEHAWVSSLGPRPEPRSYVDRLSELNIGLWTDIPISNEYAATAIRMYLETEHPLIARFDSSLFVRDLIDGRGENCSYLLVNALLCHAIVRMLST